MVKINQYCTNFQNGKIVAYSVGDIVDVSEEVAMDFVMKGFAEVVPLNKKMENFAYENKMESVVLDNKAKKGKKDE